MIRLLLAALEKREPYGFELAMIRAHGDLERLEPVAECRNSLQLLTDGVINAAKACLVPEILDLGIYDTDPGKITTEYLAAHDALPVLPEFGSRWSAEWAQKCINALNLARVQRSPLTVNGIGKSVRGEADTFAGAKAAAQNAFAEAETVGSSMELCNFIRIFRSNQWRCELEFFTPRIRSSEDGLVTAWCYFSSDLPAQGDPEWDLNASFLPEYPVYLRKYRIASGVSGEKSEDQWIFPVAHPDAVLKDISAEELPESEDFIRGYKAHCTAVLDRGTVI